MYFQTGPGVQDMALYGARNSAASTGRRRFSRRLVRAAVVTLASALLIPTFGVALLIALRPVLNSLSLLDSPSELSGMPSGCSLSSILLTTNSNIYEGVVMTGYSGGHRWTDWSPIFDLREQCKLLPANAIDFP